MEKIPKVLFFSRGSASRGQMAEGFLRSLAGDRFIPVSAGADAADVNPLAAEVMREVGIDISAQKPREVGSLFHETFHFVVVLSDEARERYPLYPFTRRLLKWSVPNPEIAAGELEAQKQMFRQVRDQMRIQVEKLIQTTGAPTNSYSAAA
ncbi:MAG: arsenate reductase ArsC [Candidatus Acidiferrales bacterium]